MVNQKDSTFKISVLRSIASDLRTMHVDAIDQQKLWEADSTAVEMQMLQRAISELAWSIVSVEATQHLLEKFLKKQRR